MYGQYQVVDRIAVGGMAEIYLGVAHGTEGFQRQVVIKKVRQRFSSDDRFHAMLVREAKITASLNHPNIVQILDLGQNESGEYFIVMEYVEGHDLRSIMDRAEAREVALERSHVLYIAGEICSALDYAHRKTDEQGRPLHLIHRDVSPSNILVSRGGEVKLADFGIARYGRDVSAAGSLKGKLFYMSPEQARTSALDHRSDLFSLGAVLFEALLRERVYPGESEIQLLENARAGRVTAPSAVDPAIAPELAALLRRALMADPRQRFASADAMGQAIRELQFRSSPDPVTPDHLARLLGELFPEGAGLPRRPSSSFTVTTLARLPGSGRGGTPQRFIDAVTSPVGPPPEVLAQLRQRGPLQAVLTREETPVFGEPGVAVEGEPTRVATPSGLAAERQGEPAPVEGQRPEQRPSALVGPVEGQRPEQRPSALVAAVSSLELVLDGDEVDVDVPTGRQERPALPPGGPPRDDLPLPADTAETALEAQPTRVVREPPAAPSARSGPPTPGPEVVPPSAPRRWLGWLLVALTGLGLGGGAALWLLVRGRRASHVSRPAPVAQGAPDAGRDSAPSRDQQTPDAVAPDSVSTQRARPVRRRHRRAGRPRPRVKR